MTTRIAITGAASGIGAATAEALRERGCAVVGLDLRGGEDTDTLACDVRIQASVDAAVASAIERLGGLDVLINCAGLGTPQSAGLPPDDAALAVIDVNLVGPWRVTSAALEALRASRGRVVNVASGLAFVAFPFAPAYCMSKHGLPAYSQALRLEHGDAISVTTVYPGYIKTPIHDASSDFGVTLDGAVPEERLEDAVATLVKAALSRKAYRDLATTRRGEATQRVLRWAPGQAVDWVIASSMARGMRGRQFDDPDHPVAQYARRVTDGDP